ncbi:MmgE/PrpD family protein [Hydrogenophaga sp.]|uniref:MmgE/PrpD family protein n=1 Tax=Hydrogenophaga sp. TaxID=1904254 RepID=UPI00272364B0|nr:MmgE/PrpD family protein [Hydrogenophaga sp.]MDO9433961.1 MmgE/PrpD family protein [Hydrogenophaga sp.]
MNDNTLHRVARYASATRFGHLTPEAVHETLRRVIDSVACAAGAYDEDFCGQMRRVAARYSGDRVARIWGTNVRTSIEMAGLVNGTMVRYLDLSDTHLGQGAGHPSDMIPALIALAESSGASGRALITAVVVAYEVYCSLCEAALSTRVLDQATSAVAGCAAGAGNLLGLDAAAMAQAVSLALAPNLHLYNVRCGELSDWKGCAGPNAARNGLFAALLASDGVTGPSAPIEGKGGLIELIGPFDWQPGAQAQPMIVQTHLKMHPVCYHGQSAVDASLALRGLLLLDQIESVEVETYDASYKVMGADRGRWEPATRETADHSLPFAVAVSLMDGVLASASYAPQRLVDPATRRFMDRIRVSPSNAMTHAYPDKAQTRITLRAQDGTAHAFLQDHPLGHAANPVSDARLEEKLVSLFAPWGDEARAHRTLETLWSLAGAQNISAVVDALCPER